MQIEVSLDVFKKLTARLSYDGQTYSELIHELLTEDSCIEPEEPSDDFLDGRAFLKRENKSGFASRKLWLPHGTELRARYKQKEYRARIDNSVWLSEDGSRYSSPSAAAHAITGNSVNGLRFWEALRPSDRTWRRLEALVLPDESKGMRFG